MNKERNYGIDLLRLVLMFMVCILHVLGQGGILKSSVEGTIGFKVFWLLEIFAYCAVDGFAFISGYMATNKPQKYEKIVNMWFQVFFYSFIVTVIFILIGLNKNWTKADIIKCAMPVIFEKYWYFTAFFGLFFATPILNKFVFTIDEKTAKKAFIIIFTLFSVIGIIAAEPFNTKAGYCFLWLAVLYCLGALAKKIKLFETKKSITLILIWILCILITWIFKCWIGKEKLVSYVSPTILLSGIIMVVLFSRMHFKGTIISKLSPLAFGIYLFQLNQVVWENIIKDAFIFITSKNILIGLGYVFAFSALIFIAGLVIEFIRSKLAKVLKIEELSKKIVEIMDCLIQKTFILLK